MTLDTPIVASAQPAVREVVGDAGVLVGETGAEAGGAWAAAVDDRDRTPRRARRRGPRRRRRHFTLEASGTALAAAYRQAADRMRIIVLCPHFEPDTAPTGVVMTRIVRELRDQRPRAARRQLAALVPRPSHRTGVEWPVDRDRADGVGLGHTRASVSGRRQVEHRPAGARLRRILGAGRHRRRARRRAVPACRCRARDVAAADARAHRLAGRRRPRRAAGVQRAGHLPGRRRAHRRDPQPARDRAGGLARTRSRTGERRRSPCSATACGDNVTAKVGEPRAGTSCT